MLYIHKSPGCYHTSTKHQGLVFLLLFLISLSSILPEAIHIVSAASSASYSGNLSLTTTVTSQDDEYNYPDQILTRKCTISCPFSDLTLTSYDSGSTYSGSVYAQATYLSDWTISPASSTNRVGCTRLYAPATGQTSSSFSLTIYAEIKNDVLTFIFNPDTILLQKQVSTTYTIATSTQPAGAATAVSYTSPTTDAYNALQPYSTTEGSLVTVPKSSNPFQTQTIPFSGSYFSKYSGCKSFDWTGTISLNLGNKVTDTTTPNPDNNAANSTTDQSSNTTNPQPNTTPSQTPTNVPLPETGTAKISNLRGDIQITKVGSNTPQAVEGAINLNVGDRIRTGAGSWLTITYSDGSKFHLAPNSELTIEDGPDNDQYKNIQVLNGLIHLWEQFKAGGRRFKIHSVAFAMVVRGSELTIAANDTGITVIVIDGTVDIENIQTGSMITLETGQSLTATADMTRQQMQQNIQSVSLSSINNWWDQVTQDTLTGSTIAMIAAVVIVAVGAAVLCALMVRRRKRSINSMLPPPPSQPST